MIDVDFSLAMHNRTGKYVIGRDLIGTPGLDIGDVYYWRHTKPPRGLSRRLSGRLQMWQVKAGTGTARGLERFGSVIAKRRSDRPLLHLDPFTVPTVELTPRDVVVCHDIGPVTHPHLFASDVGEIYDSIYRHVSSVGPRMVFVSRDTQSQFIQHYSEARLAETGVIYPAIHRYSRSSVPAQKAPVTGPFLLTVGSIGERKNQLNCIRAFGRSDLAAVGVKYVICGGDEPGAEAVREEAAQTAGVVILPHVEDAVLSWLYDNARGFVLVSRLEGFGMPVAEAIEHGLVPLVTKGSVLEEVAGEWALTAPSDDLDAIAAEMTNLLDLTIDERSERLQELREATSRFGLSKIQNEWVHAFERWSVEM